LANAPWILVSVTTTLRFRTLFFPSPPETEESSNPRPPRKRAALFGAQATEAMVGYSKKKREAQADPTFFECPAEPGPSGQRTANGNRPRSQDLGRNPPRIFVGACFDDRSAGPSEKLASKRQARPAQERRQALTGAAVRTWDKKQTTKEMK